MKSISENHTDFEDWLDGRPDCIREMVRKCPPWFFYKIQSTGQECHLVSYSEDGTVTVNITSQTIESMLGMQRQVFGIDISDLEQIPEKLDS